MKITCGEAWAELPEGATVQACLQALNKWHPGVLAARRGGCVLEVGDVVSDSGELIPLTLSDEEGYRIYERSLRFVMLLALRRLYPGQQVRIEYSVGHGVFVRLPHLTLSDEMVREIGRTMGEITAADLPFEKKTWTLEEAIRYFEEDGQRDKVELLRRRPFSYFTMYACGGMWEYFYGAMAASTGVVRVFGLTPHAPGFVLKLPRGEAPAYPAPYVDRPKHLRAFSQSAAWCEILQAVNVADLDRMIEQGQLRTFIRVNEALHDQAIGGLAQKIVAEGKRIVLIAGPSSSGKTTTAARLAIHLRVLGRHPVQISLDDYYLDRDALPREADGSVDLEGLHTIDVPLIQRHMTALLAGETVEVPRFNFVTGKREARGVETALPPGEIVIIEGIHGLNPTLSATWPAQSVHRVFVSALTCLNLDDHNRIRTTDVRLLRRIVRDHQFRGTPPQETMEMWPSVRRGEETWIFPYQEQADSVFNTALHYELPVLRHFAFSLLREVPEEAPSGLMARRLCKTLNYLPDIDPALLDEIPPLSLLREFIGGSTLGA